MHKSDFSPFSDPFMLSVDTSGVVPVGVRPPPPLRGSSPCEAGQFCIRMANKRVVTTPAAWRAEGALRPVQSLLNPHYISTALEFLLRSDFPLIRDIGTSEGDYQKICRLKH